MKHSFFHHESSEFLPKRLNYLANLTNAEGEDAETYGEVEGLEQPGQIDAEVSIQELIDQANKVFELSIGEFIDQYGAAHGGLTTTSPEADILNARIAASQALDARVDALADKDTLEQLQKLRREGK